MALCPACGTHGESFERFCGECGGALAADVTQEESAEERKRRLMERYQRRFKRLFVAFFVMFIWCGVSMALGATGVVSPRATITMFVGAMALYGVLFMITFVQGIITSIQINNASPRE